MPAENWYLGSFYKISLKLVEEVVLKTEPSPSKDKISICWSCPIVSVARPSMLLSSFCLNVFGLWQMVVHVTEAGIQTTAAAM